MDTITERGLLMLSLDMDTMAMATMGMDTLPSAIMDTITERGLLMLSLDMDIMVMVMDTLPSDTDMATTMARGPLMLSLDIITMAMGTLPTDTDMATDMASRFMFEGFLLRVLM